MKKILIIIILFSITISIAEDKILKNTDSIFEPISDPLSIQSRILFPAAMLDRYNTGISYSRVYQSKYTSDYSFSYILGLIGMNFYSYKGEKGSSFSLSIPLDRGLGFGYKYSSINKKSYHSISQLHRLYRFLSLAYAFNDIGQETFNLKAAVSVKPGMDFLTLSYQLDYAKNKYINNYFARIDLFRTFYANLQYNSHNFYGGMGINLYEIKLSSIFKVDIANNKNLTPDYGLRQDTIEIEYKTKNNFKSPQNTYITLPINGSISGIAGSMNYNGQYNLSLLELNTIAEKIIENRNVKGVIVQLDSVSCGYATAEEVRNIILRLRDHNKKVFVWAKSLSQKEYYIASAADKIYIPKMAIVDVKGIAVTVLFYKNLLDKIGVQFDVIHQGKYKSAGEPFINTNFSEPAREAEEAIIENYYKRIFSHIIRDRNLNISVEDLINNGPYDAEQALEMKLIDGIKYYNKFIEEVKKPFFQNLADIGYLFSKKYNNWWEGLYDDSIAIIEVDGAIVSGRTGNTPFNRQQLSGDESVINMLYRAANFKSTKAIILRINSPGGSVLASDMIWHAIADISSRKKRPIPIIASMGDVAASGGYYIAAYCSRIYAMPLTITGSIGVIYNKLSANELLDKIGITRQKFIRGKNSEQYSPFYKYTEEDKERITKQLKSIYDNFLTIVYDGRKKNVKNLKKSDIEENAQGRVWMGTQAYDKGLVDHLGGLHESIIYTKKITGIKNENFYYKIYQDRWTYNSPYSYLNAFTLPFNIFTQNKKTIPISSINQKIRRIRSSNKNSYNKLIPASPDNYLNYLSNSFLLYLEIIKGFQYKLNFQIEIE